MSTLRDDCETLKAWVDRLNIELATERRRVAELEDELWIARACKPDEFTHILASERMQADMARKAEAQRDRAVAACRYMANRITCKCAVCEDAVAVCRAVVAEMEGCDPVDVYHQNFIKDLQDEIDRLRVELAQAHAVRQSWYECAQPMLDELILDYGPHPVPPPKTWGVDAVKRLRALSKWRRVALLPFAAYYAHFEGLPELDAIAVQGFGRLIVRDLREAKAAAEANP